MKRAIKITRELKRYDRELYCGENKEGILCVFRRGYNYLKYDLGNDETLIAPSFSPHFVFALTDNWRTNGKPKDWGLEPLLARIRALDIWQRDIVSEILEQNDKDDLSRKRDQANSMESFLYDFRSQFKKTFSNVNTANMSKKDRRAKDELNLKMKGY